MSEFLRIPMQFFAEPGDQGGGETPADPEPGKDPAPDRPFPYSDQRTAG